jgi:hypothetical protein
VTLDLTKSNASFSVPGPLRIYLSTQTGISIDPTSTSLNYVSGNNGLASVDTDLGTLTLLGSGTFTTTGATGNGVQDVYSLTFNGSALTTLLNTLQSKGTLRLVVMEEHQGDVFISEAGGFSAGIQSGVVFRFNGQTLAQSLKISDPNPQMGASFGHSMASDASNLLVGAPGVSATGKVGVGEAYLFNADTGALLRTFVNPELDNSALFGNSVSLLGNYAVIGAPGANSVLGGASGNTDVGAAYVFDATTGAFLVKIANPANGQNQEFTLNDETQEGGLLALGDNLIATSHKTATGVAYVFSVVPEPYSFDLLAIGTLFSLAARFVRLATPLQDRVQFRTLSLSVLSIPYRCGCGYV